MTYPIPIDGHGYYLIAKARGFEPMLDPRFTLPFALRLELQRELFPDYSQRSNDKFYRWVWDNWSLGHQCQECGKGLEHYGAVHVSHIIARSDRTLPLDVKFDGRNVNLLCWKDHNRWEKSETRRGMVLYEKNLRTIEILTHDYTEKIQNRAEAIGQLRRGTR